MSKLKVRPAAGPHVHAVTPQSAGWTYVGFDVYRLGPGETAEGGEAGREACLVFVTGSGEASAGGAPVGLLGGRKTPFEGEPEALYVPAGTRWRVTARDGLELAVCTAPAEGRLPVKVLRGSDLGRETRGKGTNTRYVTNILPDSSPHAESLLVVEVITPGGHSSSYPPHKHDRDALPSESMLEETYYHRLSPPQGFAFQRVYTDARDLDETMCVEDGDVVLVPRGYHPVAAVAGYDIYYLNVMAGPKRTWKFYNAPEHEWMLG